jgi:prepilin-type N-terminal cleavage/methylation domain-containing protein
MKNKGFSLIEILLSMAIISCVITGTAELIIHSLYGKKKAEVNLKISALLTSKIESLRCRPFESPDLQSASFFEEVYEKDIGETFRIEWKIEDISPGLKRIILEIIPKSIPQKKAVVAIFLSRDLGL